VQRTEGGLTWTGGTWAALWAAVRAAYPREGCGVLLGNGTTVTGVLALTNTDQPGLSTFTMDHRELLAVYDAEDAGRLELLGYWHSHPRTSSEPSDVDRAYAVPGYAYVVAGVDGVTTFRVSE
jgi:proteasome lid subunit RPN8/RPN11